MGWVVNTHHSLGWTKESSKPSCVLPSLAFSREEGPWIGTRGRRFTALGQRGYKAFCAHRLTWPADRGTFRLLGNTGSGHVVAWVLSVSTSALGTPLYVADRWLTGAAQADLEDRFRAAPCRPSLTLS